MLPILIFLLGLCVGSFLNVVICRLGTKEPIIRGRSHCPDCRAVLKWHQLIPVLSFLLQRGKCCYCGKKISWQYPMVEIATGLLFVIIFNFQFSIFNLSSLLVTSYWLLITCFLLIIFVYDLKHYIIPDKIVYPAILVACIWLLVGILTAKDFLCHSKGWNPFIAAFLASGFFLLLVLVSKGRWMGLGDVKLAFLMGLVLSWPNVLFALFLAFLSGAIIGIGLIIAGKKGMKSQIPFGPFLAGATILIMLSIQYLDNWFQNLFYF